MNSGKVLLGLMAGLAAGAIIGVLFAPDKGSVTRKMIYKKGDEYADELKEKFNELIESISVKCEEVLRSHMEEVDKSESKTSEIKIE